MGAELEVNRTDDLQDGVKSVAASESLFPLKSLHKLCDCSLVNCAMLAAAITTPFPL
jgi:hypothetical protein